MCFLIFLLAACGRTDSGPAAGNEEQSPEIGSELGTQDTEIPAPDREPDKESQLSADNVIQQPDEKKTALPSYRYPGSDPLYRAVYEYIADEFGAHFDEADVGIPNPVIVDVDDSDPQDVLVWGDFCYDSYELVQDVLESSSGGSFPGCLHLRKDNGSYEVISADLVESGSNFDPSAIRIFGDRYKYFMLISAFPTMRDIMRLESVADYVVINGLDITAFRDYGGDDMELPVGRGVLSDTDEISLVNASGNGTDYTFTYKGERFDAVYDKRGSWKIPDSYRITSTEDMIIICEALNTEHPISGQDRVSVRTARDMAFEWMLHDIAHELVPEDSSTGETIKDVDLDPDDQNRTLIELFEMRTKKRFSVAGLLNM